MKPKYLFALQSKSNTYTNYIQILKKINQIQIPNLKKIKYKIKILSSLSSDLEASISILCLFSIINLSTYKNCQNIINFKINN